MEDYKERVENLISDMGYNGKVVVENTGWDPITFIGDEGSRIVINTGDAAALSLQGSMEIVDYVCQDGKFYHEWDDDLYIEALEKALAKANSRKMEEERSGEEDDEV